MNKKRILAIFLLLAVLITCAGVSFASSDFDNSNIDNIGSTYIDLGDDSNLNLVDDSDYDDSDYEDDDWDDDSDYEDDDSDDDSDYEDDDWDDDSDYEDDDWDEDETFELFEILKPFTTEGLLYFEANDEDPWRYRFDSKTGEWAEDGGMLVYRLNDPENEDIQKELTRRGLL